jgi:hypothetical protein
MYHIFAIVFDYLANYVGANYYIKEAAGDLSKKTNPKQRHACTTLA